MEKYPFIESYCLSLLGTEMDYKLEWQATRFMINGKMYAMVGSDKEGRTIITVKLAPENSLVLRNTYNDIRPGYYMNKIHWSSVDLNGNVPSEVLKNMLLEAHDLIFHSLSRKAQTELLNKESV